MTRSELGEDKVDVNGASLPFPPLVGRSGQFSMLRQA